MRVVLLLVIVLLSFLVFTHASNLTNEVMKRVPTFEPIYISNVEYNHGTLVLFVQNMGSHEKIVSSILLIKEGNLIMRNKTRVTLEPKDVTVIKIGNINLDRGYYIVKIITTSGEITSKILRVS